MEPIDLEQSVIGDLLMESAAYHPTPLKGVVGEMGLRSEHFADSSARAAFNLLDAIAEENAAVMIVSHDKKGDIKTQDIRDRGAGSNWAGRDVDCRFVMTPAKGDDYRMSVGILARNYPPRVPFDLRADPGRFTRA